MSTHLFISYDLFSPSKTPSVYVYVFMCVMRNILHLQCWRFSNFLSPVSQFTHIVHIQLSLTWHLWFLIGLHFCWTHDFIVAFQRFKSIVFKKGLGKWSLLLKKKIRLLCTISHNLLNNTIKLHFCALGLKILNKHSKKK